MKTILTVACGLIIGWCGYSLIITPIVCVHNIYVGLIILASIASEFIGSKM